MAGGDRMRKRGEVPVILALLVLLMLRADAARQAAAGAVQQALAVVFPSLFPFFVLSRRLTSRGLRLPAGANRLCLRLLGVPATGAFVMGLCGGYPLGVYTACERYRSGSLTKEQTRRLLLFCNNTGPAIFFGMIGARLFPEPGLCAWLFGIHALSAVLTALVFSGTAPGVQSACCNAAAGAEGLMESVGRAAAACARLCACVVFVSVLLRLALDLPPVQWLLARLPVERSVSEALICIFADLPSGLRALESVGDPTIRLVLCAGAVGWGGMCVHLQAADLWQGAGIAPRGYFAAKAFQTGCACALAAVPARPAPGAAPPLWPAVMVIAFACAKKALDILPTMRYNVENEGKRRRRHAVSQKDRAGLRLLRPGRAY